MGVAVRAYGGRVNPAWMRSLTALALVAMVAPVVAGCAPDPAPAPTTAVSFSSEEEAFAAAEETYRAYVDALNQVDLSDPGTFEAVYAWTTGEANADERKVSHARCTRIDWSGSGSSG